MVFNTLLFLFNIILLSELLSFHYSQGITWNIWICCICWCWVSRGLSNLWCFAAIVGTWSTCCFQLRKCFIISHGKCELRPTIFFFVLLISSYVNKQDHMFKNFFWKYVLDFCMPATIVLYFNWFLGVFMVVVLNFLNTMHPCKQSIGWQTI